MNLRHFPMDSQVCYLDFASYGYPVSQVDYYWKHSIKSLDMDEPPNMPIFRLGGIRKSKHYKRLRYRQLLPSITGTAVHPFQRLLRQPDLRTGHSHSDGVVGSAMAREGQQSHSGCAHYYNSADHNHSDH